MKFAKIILLVLALGCSCSPAASTTVPSPITEHIVDFPQQTCQPILAAGLFKWLDELINGTRSARHLPGQAYRYTQQEDRRGKEHGLIYYLALGIWRFAAGVGAAAIAGRTIEKQNVSAQTKNFVFIAPFVLGLLMPLFALFGAGIVWLACKEGKAEPPKQD